MLGPSSRLAAPYGGKSISEFVGDADTPWPRRVLVTGSTGFVGRHLLPRLSTAFPSAEITGASFDLCDQAAIQSAIRAAPPDACVHLAAIAAIPAAQADPNLAWQVNLQGTLALARTLMEAAPSCTLVYISTADSYGASFRSGRPVTETTVLAPMNTYAATKAAADLALGALVSEGLSLIRIRPFNHTGPGQSAAFVVASFARQIARIEAGLQKPQIHVGSLEPQRDFLDVRDVCRAYTLCLAKARSIPSGTILNIASGTCLPISDVLAALMALSGIKAEIVTDPARMRRSDIPLACADPSAARDLLQWQPEIAWTTTLQDILQDWRRRVRSQPDET